MHRIDPENVKKPKTQTFLFYKSFCTFSEQFHGLRVPKQSQLEKQAIQFPFFKTRCFENTSG